MFSCAAENISNINFFLIPLLRINTILVNSSLQLVLFVYLFIHLLYNKRHAALENNILLAMQKLINPMINYDLNNKIKII